jgi:hypothetical protein
MTLFHLTFLTAGIVLITYFTGPFLAHAVTVTARLMRSMPRGYAAYVFACAACSAVCLALAYAALAAP